MHVLPSSAATKKVIASIASFSVFVKFNTIVRTGKAVHSYPVQG
jgi:hypothetical protein